MAWPKLIALTLGGAAILGLAGFAVWLAMLPAAGTPRPQADIPAEERATTLAALAPPKRDRPLVAVLGINDATELTDYLMPYGILRRADVADVVLLATGPGPVQLYPALRVEPDMTTAAFAAAHPQGADYVIVPAMSRDDEPAALEFIRAQSASGAIVIGVCAGAKVVGMAGLLDGRRATTHWYYMPQMQEQSPGFLPVQDRRFVIDRGVATTTGITASMPAMLTLVEAIAGPEKTAEVAADLGAASWDARHDSGAFRLTRPFAGTVLANRAQLWAHETLDIALTPGMDEVALALVSDAWSRTYRTQVRSVATAPGPVVSRNGVRLLPDATGETAASAPAAALTAATPSAALDRALAAIGDRYGPRTRYIVAMQLEYPATSREGTDG